MKANAKNSFTISSELNKQYVKLRVEWEGFLEFGEVDVWQIESWFSDVEVFDLLDVRHQQAVEKAVDEDAAKYAKAVYGRAV